jgi:hypothetical protein
MEYKKVDLIETKIERWLPDTEKSSWWRDGERQINGI